MTAIWTSEDDSHPWNPVGQRTRRLEQEVDAYFQDETSMQAKYLPEEEVLPTTTCSTKDIHEDSDGWRKVFTKELDSFERLNVLPDGKCP